MFQNFDYFRNISNIPGGNIDYNAPLVPPLPTTPNGPNGPNGMNQAMNVSNFVGNSVNNNDMWCHDVLPVNPVRAAPFSAVDKVLQDGGVLIPNRIFVGGINGDTTGSDLLSVFSPFGVVKSTRIVLDQYGSCRGYGFVTFVKADVVKKLLGSSDLEVIKNRNWNIAPAVRRNKSQPVNQAAIISAPTPLQPPPPPPPQLQPHPQLQLQPQPQLQQLPHLQPQPQLQQLPHLQPQPQLQQQPHLQPQPQLFPNMGLPVGYPLNNMNVQPMPMNAAIPEPGPMQNPQMGVPFNYDLQYNNKYPPNLYFYVIS